MIKIIKDARTMNSLIKQNVVEKIREANKYYRGDYVESVKEGEYKIGNNWFLIKPIYLEGCFKPYVLSESCNWKYSKINFIWIDNKKVKVPTYIYSDFYGLYHVGIGNPDDKILMFSSFDCLAMAEKYALALGNGKRLEQDYTKNGVYVAVDDNYFFEKYKKTIQIPNICLGIFK